MKPAIVRRFAIGLAVIAALNCLWVATIFFRYQFGTDGSLRWLWPQPAINLLEVALIGLLGLLAVLRMGQPRQLWLLFLAALCGLLLAFVVLGAWTIGPPLFLSWLIFTGLTAYYTHRHRQAVLPVALTFLGAAVLQACLLLLL